VGTGKIERVWEIEQGGEERVLPFKRTEGEEGTDRWFRK